MQTFQNRKDPLYIERLKNCLTIEGKGGLLENAIPMQNFMIYDGTRYGRCCRIDFLGIAATNLFDTGGEFAPLNVTEAVEHIFSQSKKMNDKGVMVKLRILLVYPYSVYAFSRIQAEATRNRSSIQFPSYQRNFQAVESVDEQMLFESALVRTQTSMLEQLQEWTNKYNWSSTGPNRVIVRFTPVSPNFCALFVNSNAFFDAYLLAKEHHAKKICPPLSPVVEISAKTNQDQFVALEDHFRYLWDLDITLFCEDTTEYKQNGAGRISRIYPPHRLSLASKASFIKNKNSELSEKEIQSWNFKCGHILQKFCMTPFPTPGNESLFITCSWKEEGDKLSEPNEYANYLSEMLVEDVVGEGEEPLVDIQIMKGQTGKFLSSHLYNLLEESTLGLVLLTNDLEDKNGRFYSKPNIYHELGFLMNKLGEERVIIVAEQGVTIPSNVQDVERIQFYRNKLILSYGKIINWLVNQCGFQTAIKNRIMNMHVQRIDKSIIGGGINCKEGKRAKDRLKTLFK